MKKKILIIAVILLALLAGTMLLSRKNTPKAETGKELLKNGGFEEITGEGLPAHWLADAYVRLPGMTEFAQAEGSSGKGARIVNHEPNDARFYQTVEVVPGAVYRLSGKIKARADGGHGANLSIQDVYVFSESVYDSGDEWQSVELYGRTGSSQREITVFARLGGYSGEASGTAYFDELSLMAVDEAPSGVFVTRWEKQSAPDEGKAPAEPGSAGPAAPALLALMAACALAMLWFAKLAEREARPAPAGESPSGRLALALVLAAALVTRLVTAVLVRGFPVDIGCFTGWAAQMAEVGPGRFYVSDIFSDYPPGYMLVLWPLGLIAKAMGSLGTAALPLLVKLPAVACDLGIVLIIYSTARKRVGDRAALFLSMLYAFSPLPYLAGSAWGQADSVPALLLVIAVLMIMDSKWRWALPVYVLAVLMKPQALMAGPLGLAALIGHLVSSKDKARFKDAGLGIAFSLLTAAAVVLPFLNEQNGIGWLFKLYGGTMNYYDYAAVNAANLYFLFGKNWIKIEGSAPFLLRLAGVMTLAVPVGQAWARSHNRKDRQWLIAAGCLMPALAVLLPMKLSLMGTLLMVSVFMLTAWRYAAGKDASQLAVLAGVMLTGFSVLGTMMHERYLMMAVVLMTLGYALKRDRRLMWLIIAATALCFLNSGVVLDRGIRIGGSAANLSAPELGLKSDSAWLEMALSALSLPVAGYALYLGIALTRPDEQAQLLAPAVRAAGRGEGLSAREAVSALNARQSALPWSGRERLFVIAAAALYAALAFVNLGSLKAPQTPWVSDSVVSQAAFDLGESRQFNLLFYGGIHQRVTGFTVETSEDGIAWSEPQRAMMKEGLCFTWFYHRPIQDTDKGPEYFGTPTKHTGRYVRLTSEGIGLTLYEMLARDAETKETLKLKALEPSSGALCDEQNSLDGEPGWFNSMYFDEIYHGRSGFEMLNAIRGQEPSLVYENTHPQLGKLLMSFFIMIFGMVPFGWRFAGALAGVLMLPGMYLLGREMTGRRGGGMLALGLMAFDFMHFTQTRIATIDSFVTLFIIYAYLFMIRFIRLDYFALPLGKTLKPLFLSGLMMGLAISSKWTGIYAGIGLGVLFFWAMARWGSLALAAERLPEAERAKVPGAALNFKKRALITLLFCVLFFIVIPLIIYTVSFIPMFVAEPGGFTLKKVIDINRHMYNYHSEPGRGADHFFNSPWYEWPFAVKPMWYYAGGVAGGMSSTIIAFGSPLVWWGGSLAMLGLMAVVLAGLMGGLFGTGRPVFRRGDARPAVIVISFLAQYLPWVLVPRGTYIYHFFPSVPFVILALVLWQDAWAAQRPGQARAAGIVLIALSALLFAAFFPYLSGVRVSVNWLSALQWFPNWLYF